MDSPWKPKSLSRKGDPLWLLHKSLTSRRSKSLEIFQRALSCKVRVRRAPLGDSGEYSSEPRTLIDFCSKIIDKKGGGGLDNG